MMNSTGTRPGSPGWCAPPTSSASWPIPTACRNARPCSTNSRKLGLNEKLGYKRPGDLRDCNAKFYWKSVNPYIQEATRYLKVTQEGRQWVANLQANVFGDKLFNTEGTPINI